MSNPRNSTIIALYRSGRRRVVFGLRVTTVKVKLITVFRQTKIEWKNVSPTTPGSRLPYRTLFEQTRTHNVLKVADPKQRGFTTRAIRLCRFVRIENTSRQGSLFRRMLTLIVPTCWFCANEKTEVLVNHS